MKTFSMLKAGVAPTALSLALVAAPALAQDAAAGTPQAGADDTAAAQPIVVTGSRIASPNLTSVAPITAVSQDEFKALGTTKTEDLLNSLPQVFASQSSTLSNGATGTATVDLRGLGPSRTLVLVNGRRLMPGDPNARSSAADLNNIPSSLVKRVDVLTGGASSTYGADAVSGVVNFIIDTDFEGFRVDTNYGLYQHSNGNQLISPLLGARNFPDPKGNAADGQQFDATVSFGTKFGDDQGHMTAYFGYRKVNPVLQANRDYSACTIQNTGARLTNPTRLNPAAPLQCGGSATSNNAILFADTGSGLTSTLASLGNGTVTPGAANRYNFAPLNYFQRPDERYTAGVFADYEINQSIHPYMEFMFMNDRTVAQIAPSGDFGNTLTINCDNPLMSAQQRSVICAQDNLIVGNVGSYPLTATSYRSVYGTTPPGAVNYIDPTTGATYNKGFFQLLRRNVEGGPRINDLTHTSFRGVIGTKGDLGEAWSYDVYYQYGRTNYTQVYSNEFSTSRLVSALDAVAGPGGTAVCRAAQTGADPNCVPYNVFSGTPSAASINYVSSTGFQSGYTSEQVASGYISGDLGKYNIKAPWASQGVSIVLGAEYRKESLDLKTDNAFSTGDLTGQGAPTLPVSGSYKVSEFFTEAEVPLVQDSFFYNLSLSAGYRYSHYSVSNGNKYNTNTYKFGVDFAPISDIRFRGAYNRAVRAPNIQELFGPQIVALDGVTDPCAGKVLTAADVGCLLQGLRVGQRVTANPAAQYNGFIGGNPNLRPEIATTKTAGVVIQPHWVRNLSLSVDYYDIKVKGAIQGFGSDAILASCVNDVNAFACGLIHRNAAGSLWLTSDGFVQNLPTNIGGVQTKGWDFNFNYALEVGKMGRVSASLVGTALTSYKVDNGLTALYDCAGYYGPTCGVPQPKWRHKARLTWAMPNGITLSGQWRFYGGVDVEYKNPSASLNSNYYNFNSHIGSQSYFDLSLTARIGNHYTWRLGATNLFDKEPPLVTSGSGAFGASACSGTYCNGNTYPGVYDSLGRYIYTGITLDF